MIKYKNYKDLIGKWKLIDDRSGFEIYSDEAIIDDKGFITSRKNYEPIHWSELPVILPIDEPVPVLRLEPEDYFITVNYPQYAPATWNTYSGTWATADTNWEASKIL
jgi:hypothetical protein